MIRRVKMRLPIISLLFAICFATSTYSQRIVFENLTVDDGLSQNSVLAIVQDSRGFMWYGTQHGLNKYNSRSFKIYSNDPADPSSISSDYVTALLVDAQQVLWVGTRSGLNRYNPETDNFEHVNLRTTAATGPQIISSIYQDRQNNVWVWSSEGLKRLANRQTNTFNTIAVPDSVAGLYGTNSHSLYQDDLGTYWIGSSAGLTKMQQSGGRFVFTMFKHNALQPGSLSDNYVTAINQDGKKGLWIGTLHGGVNFYNQKTGQFSHFLSNAGAGGPVNNNIRTLSLDAEGKLWIGTQAGLSILDPASRRFTHYTHDPENKNSLSQNSIYSIFIDRNRIVWIGTYWGGVNMVSSLNNTFLVFQTTRYHSVINNNVISAVTEDARHNLWIGTEGGGLNYFDRSTDKVTTYQNSVNDQSSLGSNLVKVVYVDRDHHVWVGTHGGGLNLFDPSSNRFKRYLYKENDAATLGSEVLSILEDGENNFWVGTQTGLLAFKRTGTDLQPANNKATTRIGRRAINSLIQDDQKNIWIGTNTGLFRINHKDGTIATFSFSNGKPIAVNRVYQDSHRRIWVGTYYSGLALYNAAQNTFTNYTQTDGLPNNNVLGILDAGQNLWISTSNGLSKFNLQTHSFKNYSKSDGLGGNTFNINSCFKTTEGEMLFGGFNGLTSFFPAQIEENNVAPPVIITGLKLFNKPVEAGQADRILSKDISLTQSIVFSHEQNVFTIDFAALNYVKSEKNRYAYKLDGFDRDWVYTTIPSAPYTNLPHGDYTFFAKGTNNDGVWGNAAVLHIRVLPPFWQTIWAYALYVLLISGLVFFIARFFILRSILRRDQELTQLKLNFFTNISHEIRTHLSLIFGPVEKLMLHSRENAADERQLQIIKKNSDSLLQLVNELMDFRKAETGNLKLNIDKEDIVELLQEIYACFYDTAVSGNITTDFVASADHIWLYFDREQLEKVFYNLIYNAFKFTEAGGFINVLIEERKDDVVVTITDNGKGIAPENLKKLFDNYFQENDHGKQNTGYGVGLALAKSITELHKGIIDVDSKVLSSGEKRTSFSVKLLKGNTHFHQEHSRKQLQPVFPALKRPAPVIGDDRSQPILNPVINPGGKKPVILLVEDNHDVRQFIAGSLLDNYEVITAENGVNGLALAINSIPDVIVSDVMMPEMDGFTLCNTLKADERTSHIPVILLTAKATGDSHISGLKMGADIYLTKPFSIEVLLLQVNNLLQAGQRIRDNYARQIRAGQQLAKTVPAQQNTEDLQTRKLPGFVDDAFLNKVIALIEKNIDNVEFGVPELANQVGMSQPVLYKKLAALTGLSVNDFIKSVRMSNALNLLKQRQYTIYEVAYMVGFTDRKYFSKEFKKQYGKAPSEFVEEV